MSAAEFFIFYKYCATLFHMQTLEKMNEEIVEIKARNGRVEIDKAWETSWTRRGFIMLMTFVIASTWLIIINETEVLLKAVVPTLGYLLSTLSIPWIKKIWVRYRV